MAYLRAADELHHFVAPTAKRQNKRGFFGRMFDAMVEGRRHSAEREIERILSSSTRL
jgi:hypothetical protein